MPRSAPISRRHARLGRGNERARPAFQGTLRYQHCFNSRVVRRWMPRKCVARDSQRRKSGYFPAPLPHLPASSVPVRGHEDLMAKLMMCRRPRCCQSSTRSFVVRRNAFSQCVVHARPGRKAGLHLPVRRCRTVTSPRPRLGEPLRVSERCRSQWLVLRHVETMHAGSHPGSVGA